MEFVEEFSVEERETIAADFKRLKDVHYLDTAGSGLYAESQIQQVAAYLAENLFCNPHTSRATENIIDSSRYQ